MWRRFNLTYRMVAAYLMLLFALFLIGCDGKLLAGSGPTPTSPFNDQEVTELTAADEAAIYAAVISTIYRRRGDDIGGVDAPIIYVSKRIEAGGSLESDAQPPPPRMLDMAGQQAIEAAMPDLPAQLVWVDSYGDVPFVEDLIPGADNGATISVSHIARRADGAALVAASLSFNCNCELGGGSYYIVEFVDGRWQVTGSEADWES